MNTNHNFSVRTDMADEAHRLWLGDAKRKGSLSGVIAQESKLNNFELTEIHILDEEGEAAIGKAKGRYYSLLLPENFSQGSEHFIPAVDALAELIFRLAGENKNNVLVAALGNPDISPDALGHLSAQSILVTRHLDFADFPFFNSVALCRPGVLGTSGIESALQIKAMTELIKPKLVIVIDALAGSDVNRLCRCIQISDAGISPGSGVGNDRAEISFSFLGTPVISIGMPTVIDAGLFGGEALQGMFVTGRNIDSLVRNAAKLIAYSINKAVHNGIGVSDMDALLN